jgi:cytochrome c oxidase subunit 2
MRVTNHTYMPIAVRVVSKAEFDKWVEQHKKTAGLTRPTHFAAATVPANR